MFAEYQSLSNVDPQTIEMTRLGGGAMRIRFKPQRQQLPAMAALVKADQMPAAAANAYGSNAQAIAA